MIAILIDKKDFRKTIFLPRWKQHVKIPLPMKLSVNALHREELEFQFEKWLEEGEVAIYKETN